VKGSCQQRCRAYRLRGQATDVQGISITLNEKKPDITISKEESIVSMKR